MKQYLELLETIKKKGTYKPAARKNMPRTQSLFGHQLRCDLQEGFPLLTTKKMYWKGVVIELLWFLRGDTNIKYLVDNGVNIWNEDAYQYYCKIAKVNGGADQNVILQPVSNKLNTRIVPTFEDVDSYSMFTFEEFVNTIRSSSTNTIPTWNSYKLGDCGYQYGKVWRNFGGVDQIKTVIDSLRKSPESRRHIVTAIDPVHDTDLALYWCHCMIQFNCRPLSVDERLDLLPNKNKLIEDVNGFGNTQNRSVTDFLNELEVPKYYLDCHLYQRSADVFLGVPFNIASYALLTHVFAKICNMVSGEFIHTFGDVHIYDNHRDAVDEQLTREPVKLPTLVLENDVKWSIENVQDWQLSDFKLNDYNPQSKIQAELSTGLIK